ncbi:hypothetical protein HLB44_14870 [Aquincola sp. S2]|uniref:Uncharacterized protein n=1 Tax=Pseudaquabacterium terrae TaxID=2732868 RepID=A0ABX2EI40_9BURK|nr:hypothetical protein [Aquabacterium terrae]NRF68273.1 hypothetical protein [Aquabacterium terrae]
MAAHWRGELPLWLSFWINCALLGLLGSVAAGAAATWVDVTAGPVRLAAIAVLIVWPLALVLQGWGLVGAWRSADAWTAQGGPLRVAHACSVAVVLAASATLTSTVLNFIPRLKALGQMAVGIDPAGQVVATLSADGRRLRLQGPLGIGDGARVKQQLALAPRVRLLELDSRGGRFHEAQAIADAVRGQGWTIRVTGACSDACTLVLMAGGVRQILPGAQVVIRRAPPAVFNPLFARLARHRLAELYRHAGLPDGFVRKALALPPTHAWRPAADELAAGGIVSAASHPLDVAVPMLRDASSREFAEALNTNPVWQVLERRYPRSIAAAAERMRVARDGGAELDAVMAAGQGVVEELLAKLLFNAGSPLREHFVDLLAQQLDAAREGGVASCHRVLAGDTVARRALPAELAVREAAWLVDAAAEPLRQTAMRSPSALEIEVIRRSLGGHAPALLSSLRHPPDAGPRHCERIAALLAELPRLPHGERRLAIRLIFERP